MSDSEDEIPIPSMAKDDSEDDSDDGPSTSWGLRRRNKRPVISDSENDDDLEEEVIKDDGESGDSDSSDDTPGARTCAICLGRMRGEVGSPDACEHTFCKFCLLEWAKTNATCPQDRIPFTLVLVRKMLGGPISKEIPIPKGPAPNVYEFVEVENPTYCEVCNQCNREERLLLCDGCDLGYHLECLDPPLTQVPVEEWFCPVCVAVDVPETLSSRITTPNNQVEQTRRSLSRSRSTPQENQELRIPRTRATERIREHIQRKKSYKKKLKRQRRKENKKAKIESGELEDTRPPVKQLTDFKYFIEEHDDIDAEHTEDRYADQLLSGVTQEAARLPSQRKAAAARRLRDVAFTPHASYAGRVKNKVLEIVNTQSEETGNDLLSGILEKQTIAFSSSKKLLLTNDRKLVKQPDAQFSCNIFEKSDSVELEPLPSQRKSPEKQSVSACSSSEDKQNSLELQKSPSRSLHPDSSSYKEKPCSQYEEKHNFTRTSDRNKEGKHTHHHSRHSRHGSHHSSHGRSSNYEPSCSYGSKDRSYVSSRWKDNNYQKGYHNQYEGHERQHRRGRSPHERKRSPGRDKRRNRRGSPGSSRYDGYHDQKSSFSSSHNSHSRSKRKSGHSFGRSQWSYNYFNTSDSFISKNNQTGKIDQVTSGTEDQSNSTNPKISGEKKSGDVSSDVSLEKSSVEKYRHFSVDNLPKHNLIQGETSSGVSDECARQSEETSLTSKNEVLISAPDHNLDNGKAILTENNQEKKQERSTLSEGITKDNGKKGQKKYSVDVSTEDYALKMPEESSSRLSLSKKLRISALFRDLEGEQNTSKVSLNTEKLLEESSINCPKFPKKSKSKLLFGYDSDDSLNSKDISGLKHEISEYKLGKNYLKDTSSNEGVNSSHKDWMSSASEYEEEYNPLSGSIYNLSESSNKKVMQSNETKTSEIFIKKLPTANSEKHYRKNTLPHEKHVSEENEAKSGADSHRRYNRQEPEVRLIEKSDDKKDNTTNKGDTQTKKCTNERKELEHEAKCNEKYSSKKESHSVTYGKFHKREKEMKDSTRFVVGEKESKSYEGNRQYLKEKLKTSDENATSNSRNKLHLQLHEKNHGKTKELECIHDGNQRKTSELYLIDNSTTIRIENKPHETKNIKEKLNTKEKEYKSCKYDDNRKELHPLERCEVKDMPRVNKYESRKAVEIPEKYKKKLSQLADLIGKDGEIDFWENSTYQDDNSVKTGNSKNNGVGRKYSSKISSTSDKKNEESSDPTIFKGIEKKDNFLSNQNKSNGTSLNNGRTADSKLGRKTNSGHDFLKGKKQRNSDILIDLFGDIDDIGSSSCSNIQEVELEDNLQKPGMDTYPKDFMNDEKLSVSFEGKIMKSKDFHEEVSERRCYNTSKFMLDEKQVDNEDENKGLAMFRCAPVSNNKEKSADKCDASLRIKQQKAALETRVVEEVKKFLDPFYRSRSITKDEYKQIVAKCVKKVVTAECGDVIEPEKMHALVLGYVKVYKHRQKKLNI